MRKSGLARAGGQGRSSVTSSWRSFWDGSERKPGGQNIVPPVKGIVRHGKLAADANQHGQAPPHGESAQDDPGGDEKLIQPLVLAVRPVGVVGFDFGPENLGDPVLQHGVDEQRGAGSGGSGAVVRDGDAYGALEVEIAPAFAESDSRGEGEVVAGKILAAGGRGETGEQAQGVVALLFVGGEQAILEQEILIGPTGLGRRSVEGLPGGNADVELNRFGEDKLQCLAAPEAGQIVAVPHGLLLADVIAEHFLEARRGSGDGRRPMRLLGAGQVHALEPVGEIVGDRR